MKDTIPQNSETPKARPSGTISKDGRGPAQLVGLFSLSHHSTNLGRNLRRERQSRENFNKQSTKRSRKMGRVKTVLEQKGRSKQNRESPTS